MRESWKHLVKKGHLQAVIAGARQKASQKLEGLSYSEDIVAPAFFYGDSPLPEASSPAEYELCLEEGAYLGLAPEDSPSDDSPDDQEPDQPAPAEPAQPPTAGENPTGEGSSGSSTETSGSGSSTTTTPETSPEAPPPRPSLVPTNQDPAHSGGLPGPASSDSSSRESGSGTSSDAHTSSESGGSKTNSPTEMNSHTPPPATGVPPVNTGEGQQPAEDGEARPPPTPVGCSTPHSSRAQPNPRASRRRLQQGGTDEEPMETDAGPAEAADGAPGPANLAVAGPPAPADPGQWGGARPKDPPKPAVAVGGPDSSGGPTQPPPMPTPYPFGGYQHLYQPGPDDFDRAARAMCETLQKTQEMFIKGMGFLVSMSTRSDRELGTRWASVNQLLRDHDVDSLSQRMFTRHMGKNRNELLVGDRGPVRAELNGWCQPRILHERRHSQGTSHSSAGRTDEPYGPNPSRPAQLRDRSTHGPTGSTTDALADGTSPIAGD